MGLWWDDPNHDPLQDFQDFKDWVYAQSLKSWRPDFPATVDIVMRGNINMSDTYVALYPYSNTNPTAKFRVVKSDDWWEVVNGEKKEYKFTEFDKMDEAIDARNQLNAEGDKE